MPATLEVENRKLNRRLQRAELKRFNAKIFEVFDGLVAGAVLELKEEADPRSLRNEFAQYRRGRFCWDARNLGSARWTIWLERIDDAVRHCSVSFALHAVFRRETVNDCGACAQSQRTQLPARRYDFRRG
jgi:uncharacterized protein (DUF2249 family)